jgi:hypothetical protein
MSCRLIIALDAGDTVGDATTQDHLSLDSNQGRAAGQGMLLIVVAASSTFFGSRA